MYFRNNEQGLNDWLEESIMENAQDNNMYGMPYQMHPMSSSPWMEDPMLREYDDDPDPRFRRRRRRHHHMHHMHHHIHHHFIHHRR